MGLLPTISVHAKTKTNVQFNNRPINQSTHQPTYQQTKLHKTPNASHKRRRAPANYLSVSLTRGRFQRCGDHVREPKASCFFWERLTKACSVRRDNYQRQWIGESHQSPSMGSANQVADGRNTTTDVGTLTDRRIAQSAG